MNGRRAELVPRIGRRAWLALGMNSLSCLGSGLTMPFLIIYLHEVRHIPLPTAGAVLGVIGVAGIVATPLSGPLVDRVGALRAFVIGLVVGGLGIGAFALATSPATALGCAIVYGSASGLMWNGFASLLVELVPPAERGAVFALRYMTANVAFGAGALVSGLVTVSKTPGPFAVILLGDALSYLLFAAALTVVGRRLLTSQAGAAGAPPATRERIGYRQVLGDRALLGALAVNSLIMVVALSSTNSALPAFVTGEAGASTRVVGLAFALNIAVLVAIQLFGIRFVRGRRRTRVAALATVFFALTWLLIVTPTALGLRGPGRDALIVAAMGVFAVGEALLSPTLPAVINDLAPDHLRGRYNAVFSLSYQIGPVAAPAIAGAAIGFGHAEPYLFGLAAACLLTGGLALRLGRITPRHADYGTTEEDGPAGGGTVSPGPPDRSDGARGAATVRGARA
ncbi:MFS transporter [Micromonospora sp. DT233]|uniref:MFS transporter n=1 Tax=Micromonospora sp. DT233 TaxID=3393432 RepID=UPI003CE83EFD